MIRRYVVYPDPDTGIVGRDDLVAAMVQVAHVLDFAGGSVSVALQRVRAAIEGERVTTAAVIEWKSHPKSDREEPESDAALSVPQPVIAPEPGAEQVEDVAVELPADAIGDGLDGLQDAEPDRSEVTA